MRSSDDHAPRRRPAPGALHPLLTLLVVLTSLTGCGLGGVVSDLPLPGQHPAGFYSPPDPLPDAAAGTLIRSEPISLGEGTTGWRVLYHSRSVAGADIAVSGAVFVGSSPAPVGGRPVVAWAHGTTGLGDRCAPSSARDPLGLIPEAKALLAAGYALVATDYEGIGTPGTHPYLEGTSEAHSVLDSVRAARQLPGADLSSAVVVLGHSQGGQAALFSGQLAARYAPDLDLEGVVAAAPPTDLAALAANMGDLSDGSAYLLMLAAGYSAVDPAAYLTPLLTPQGKKDSALLEDACVGELISRLNGVAVSQVFLTDPRTTPPWSEGFVDGSTGTLPRRLAVLVVQGGQDSLVPQRITDAAVRRLCTAGDRLTYTVYPAAGHDVVPSASAEILPWIADRFAGRSAGSTC